MRKFLVGICALAMAAPLGIAPAMSAPISVPTPAYESANVVQAQYDSSRSYRGDRRGDRRWRGDRNPRFEYRGDNRAYYRGHRGYRSPRAGYRQLDGFWFPPAAFIAGAIIGGAMNQPQGRVVHPSAAHVEWCYDRYRSYRASDNTFQPYNGPRRQCRSPFG